MKNHLWSLFAALSLVAATQTGSAQSVEAPVIKGVVADSNGRRISFALVSAEGLGDRVADDSGRFLLSVPRTTAIRLNVRRVGFHPSEVRVVVTRDTVLHVILRSLPASLARVTIEAEATVTSLELGGFYARVREKERGTNTGHFILPEQIEQRRGSLAQVVTGVPGLRVERFKPPGDNSSGYLALFGNARKVSRTGLCPMTIYLDRIRLQPPGNGALGRDDAPPVDINDAVTLREVAGIEVYTRTNVPFEFSMLNGTCGVVVIWTK